MSFVGIDPLSILKLTLSLSIIIFSLCLSYVPFGLSLGLAFTGRPGALATVYSGVLSPVVVTRRSRSGSELFIRFAVTVRGLSCIVALPSRITQLFQIWCIEPYRLLDSQCCAQKKGASWVPPGSPLI